MEAEDLPPFVSPDQCDLIGRVVTDAGGIGVTVPGTGEGSVGYALFEDGTQVLDVETLADGTVQLAYVGPEDATTDFAGVAAASEDALLVTAIAECDDTSYNLSGYIYDGRLDWWLRTSSIPGYLDVTNVLTAFRNGIKHITHEDNDCNQPDNVSATSNYQGSTTRRADFVNGTATCGTYDGKDVVDFGSMGATGPLAYTCNDKSGGRIIESDVRFNEDKGQVFVSNPGPGCNGKWDLESLMTHERGHSYGLNHVSGEEHAELTMYRALGVCEVIWRSLGNGDMRGLEVMY